MAKSRIGKVLGAMADIFSDTRQQPAADHSAAAMAALRALFVSGSRWEDLRLAGDDGKSHLPRELAQQLADIFAGKLTKLTFYDKNHPEKTLVLDKKLLSDPEFAKKLLDGTAMEEPRKPSAYQKWMNTLFGSYQAEMDEYQRKKTLYDAKRMMAQGKKLDRDQLPLPEEMQTIDRELHSETVETAMEKEEELAAQQMQQRQQMTARPREAEQAAQDAEEEELTPAERRRREALATLNRDDAGKGEIVDAVAVLLTCQAVRGQEAVEKSEERFDKAVGKMKKQPSFLELTREPDNLRAWLLGQSPQRMESELLHKLKAMGQALALRAAAGERKKQHAAPGMQREAPQKAPPVRVPQLVLTMGHHAEDGDKKK